MSRHALLLALGGAALALVLVATAVPGAFTIDESNYTATVVALRHGRLTLPLTDGLPASHELLGFDPAPAGRVLTKTPVGSSAPPLYAPVALPFSLLGWRGLVALNALGFVVTIGLVALFASRAGGPRAGAWATAAFALGAYGLEYAQGVWPHMICVALTTGAFVLAGGAAAAATGAAFASGLLAGLATGMRYQNVVFAGSLGLVLLARRAGVRRLAAYAVGAALPLAACSFINKARLDSWNPISKGTWYLNVAKSTTGPSWTDPFVMFWARVVDYSVRPPLDDPSNAAYLHPTPGTGAWIIDGVMKKAWLQSSPWIGLALVVLVACWWPAGRRDRGETASGVASQVRDHLRALAIPVAAVLAVFAAAGPQRFDGLNFNQRYFHELVPLVAIAFGLAMAGRAPRNVDAATATTPWSWPLALGALAGAAVAAIGLAIPASEALHQRTMSYLPLAAAVLLVVLWTRRERAARVAAPFAGACIAYAFVVHAGSDLRSSRDRREANRGIVDVVSPLVPERSALFAWAGFRDAFAPLSLASEVLVLDNSTDEGRTTEPLARALLAKGTPVFIWAPGQPATALRTFQAAGRLEPVAPRVPLARLR